jgi:hypothetical protein
VVDNQYVITKVYFPRLILPLSAVLSGLVDFCISFVMFVAIMIYYRIHPTAAIDRLLRVGGIVAFDDAHWSAVHEVCRFVATNRAYRACAVVGGTSSKTLGARMARWGASRFPLFRRVVHSRISETDEHLGFSWNSRLIAFEKLADDTRRWDFHREF